MLFALNVLLGLRSFSVLEAFKNPVALGRKEKGKTKTIKNEEGVVKPVFCKKYITEFFCHARKDFLEEKGVKGKLMTNSALQLAELKINLKNF